MYAHNLDIDLPNYLTELVVKNFLVLFKRPMPTCAFWKKDIASQHDNLQDLAKMYSLELIGMKQLLKVFDGDVIAKYYTESKWTGFKRLKKANQQQIIYDLYQLQMKKPEPTIVEEIVPAPAFNPEKSSFFQTKIL